MLPQKTPNWLLILAAAFVIVDSGCAHHAIIDVPDFEKAPPAAPGASPTVDSNSGKADPSIYTLSEYNSDKVAYDNAIGKSPMDLQSAKLRRDSIVYGMATDIDVLYNKYYGRLFSGRNTAATVGDALTLGLGAAGSIATNSATKTIFAALGTAISGLNLSVSKNFYAEQSFQVLGVAMQTRRDKARAAIYNQLTQDVTVYPLNAAKRDLIAYMQAGTLPAGLQELQEEAGAATNAPKTAAAAVPAAPTNLVANAGITQNALTWTAVAGASTYNIYYGPTTGVTATNGTKVGPISMNDYVHTSLPSRPFVYVVTAVNSSGESPASAEASATPLAAGLGLPAAGLQPPTNVTAQPVGSTIVVTWSVPQGAVKFNVYSDSATPVAIGAGTLLANCSQISNNVCTDQSPKTGPHYVVEAIYAGGNKVESSGVAPTAPPPPAIPKPAPVQAIH